MRDLLRVTLRRHRVAAVACAAVTLVTGLLVLFSTPPRWRVDVEVYVHEPVAMHRIANPFVAPPRQGGGLEELKEQVTSRASLVAMVKRTGLVDQWAASRPLPLRLRDRALELVRGPAKEADVLDALVGLLEKRVHVTVAGDRVKLSVEWSDPQVARGLARSALYTLMRQRETRDVTALEAAEHTLEEQISGVRTEIATRTSEVQEAVDRAALAGRLAAVDADREQIFRDQQRVSELLVRAEEKHLAAEVMRRSNAQRFIVVRPPMVPRDADGPGAPGWALLLLLASALSGLGGAITVGLTSGHLVSPSQLTRLLGLKVVGRVQVPWAGRQQQTASVALGLAAVLAAATGISVGLSRGSLLIAVLPLAAAAVAWFLWTQPMKWPLLVLLLLAVTVDDPTDRPYAGLWRSPLWQLGEFFYTNVAWFSGFELSVLALFALMFVRRLLDGGRRASRLDPVDAQSPRVLRLALVLSAASLAWLVVYGLLRGGDLRVTVWQARALLLLPAVGTLAMYAFDFPRDLKWIAGVVVTAAVVKSLLATYFIYRVALPAQEYPPHTTGHDDTMIFVAAAMLCFALVWEKPTWESLLRAMGLMLFVAMALRLNDRRIAYVDLALAVSVVYLVSPRHRMKRFVTRVGVLLLPLLAVYVVAGWHVRTRHGFFRPVQTVRQIFAPRVESDDAGSNAERDIENYNITRSWQSHMLFGQGFGHAFDEHVRSNDFSQSRYGQIGHNAVLWLLFIGGMVGFTGVLLYLAVAAFLAGLTLRRARSVAERVALLVSLSVFLTYVMQGFGDMGLLSVQYAFVVGVALAVTGRLASRHRVLEPALEVPALPAAA